MTLLPIKEPLAWEPFGRERFALKAFLESGVVLRSWDMVLDEHRLIHELSANSGPSLGDFTAAKYFKSHIFVTVCCSPAHQILGLFKEVLGTATGMSVAPLMRQKKKKKSIWKVIVFSICCPT